MNIHADPGDKIIVTENSLRNGYPHVEQHAREHLEIDKVYTVDHTEVDNWSTAVFIKEIPNETFNVVSFEDYRPTKSSKASMTAITLIDPDSTIITQRITDPHHGGCDEWGLYDGVYWHRAVGTKTWTQVRKVKLTPQRVEALATLKYPEQ